MDKIINANPFDLIFQKLDELDQKITIREASPNQQIEVINRGELMKRLSLTAPTVIKYTRLGKIPQIKIGDKVLYNWPSVVAKLEAK
jgi:hypothetical protein